MMMVDVRMSMCCCCCWIDGGAVAMDIIGGGKADAKRRRFNCGGFN